MTAPDDWPTEPPDPDAGPEPADPGPEPSVHAGRDVDQSVNRTWVHGDQYTAESMTINHSVVTQQVTSIMRRRHTSAPTLAEQVRHYVPPPGLDECVSRLATGRSLVLLCPGGVPRSGQRAAAAYLIHRLDRFRAAAEHLSFQEPLLDRDDEAADALRDAKDVGLYLNVADLDDGPDAVDRLRQFGVLEDGLPETGAYAVLAVSDRLAEEAEKYFPGRLHRLRRPSAEAVFRSWAAELPAPLLDALTSHPWIRENLRGKWPPDAADLAKFAVRAYRAGVREPAGLVRQVEGASTNWRDQARNDLQRYGSAPQRALLLAAAMVEGAEPATVVAARDLLLDVAGRTAELPNALERTDVVTELQALRETTFDTGTREFARSGYGTSVLHLAWRDYPGLRDVLLRWLGRLPSVLGADPAGIGELTSRIVALSAEERSDQIAWRVTREWATDRRLGTTGSVAAILLLRDACLHPRIGADSRRRVYQHAYWTRSPAAFRVVLAEAVGAFDRSHQTTAMTRLKHLARSPEDEVRAAVTRAATRLARDTGMSLDQLLSYLTGWLSAAEARRCEVAAAVATQVLAGPDGDTRIRPAAGSLRFWRAALGTLSPATSAALIRGWLRSAGPRGPDRVIAIGMLLDAAGNDVRRLGQLLYAARSGPGADEEMDDLYRHVRLQLGKTLAPPSRTGSEA
ncbi:hypothetical protein ACTOB_007670 [Actinoplanes oblitus]|uniref:LigA protein n=1 Tax=Actinoplanes oblitus TaxID=3040509 RepID=A0ABY8WEQ9_9ACTN|nr:hypothetical protein [Actinoplanes oblitus]WIM95553.1 hypothetical protein ACTOB_007670 [Actinoplanes oblitus]